MVGQPEYEPNRIISSRGARVKMSEQINTRHGLRAGNQRDRPPHYPKFRCRDGGSDEAVSRPVDVFLTNHAYLNRLTAPSNSK